MRKRSMPAVLVAGALLLAASPLFANDDSPVALAPAKARGGYDLPHPVQPPVACPALPGDDDMPNRSGSGRGGALPGVSQANPATADGRGERWSDFWSVLRERWLTFWLFAR